MAFALGRCTLGVVLLLLSLLVPISEAQKAFSLSIDCGTTKPYTDNAGITWVPDNSSYITTGLISNNVTSQLPGSNSTRHKSLRYFPEKRRKVCYQLPATKDTSYLVRTTFLYGDYDGGLRKPTFQLHIDTSNVGLIRPDNSSKESVIEVIMLAVASSIQLCLAPNTPGTDVPFINSIELWELASTMYPKTRQDYMMITNYRYNFGGDQEISYPIDTYNRHWVKPPVSSVPDSSNLTSTQAVVVGNYSRDKAPVEVMNTALYWPQDTTFTFPFNVSGGRSYVVLLWFADIDPNSQNSQSREFEVGIDGNWQNPINIHNKTKYFSGANYEAYEWGYSSVTLTDASNIAFRATINSKFGPILNAMEVYEISDPVQPITDTGDVAAIDAIKSHWLNLNTWTGDPCLKLPYDWTSCSLDTAPRITKLVLAGYNLTGSIPGAAIANLTELTALHLQNNNLTDKFPAWVENLPALQELYVEGNNLTGYVPQSLFNKTGLKFTYSPRGLCTGASPTAICSSLPESVSPAASPVALKSSSSNNLAIIIGCVAGGLGLIILICFIFLVYYKRKPISSPSSRHLLKEDAEAAFECSTKCQTMAYTLSEVKDATNNFKDQIGEGSFGAVFKGELSDGREVAVKRCHPSNRQGATEFFEEVEILSRVHHRNLVSLVGYCREEQEQILVYEYLSNSDLRTHLHGDKKHLPWSTRLAIALDAAQGIEHLHTSCNPGILHREVRSSNILLTRKMTAKVANFGFAKFISEQDDVKGADVKHTVGYLDPEYMVSRNLTEKSDVYGFGVVLLELISGQEPINKTVSDRNPLLIEWMRPLLGAEDIKAVVDPSLGEGYNLECMWRIAELGMMCVEPRAHNRPTMTDVLQELRDAIAMEETAQVHAHPRLTSSFASSTSDRSSRTT